VLVVGDFVSDVEAMCWLTILLSQKAVVKCCGPAPTGEAEGDDHGGWYGFVNAWSSSALDVGSGGLSCALAMMAIPGVGLTVVRRFASLQLKEKWLVTSEARDFLSVLSTPGGAAASPVPAIDLSFGGSYRGLPMATDAAACSTLGRRASLACVPPMAGLGARPASARFAQLLWHRNVPIGRSPSTDRVSCADPPGAVVADDGAPKMTPVLPFCGPVDGLVD